MKLTSGQIDVLPRATDVTKRQKVKSKVEIGQQQQLSECALLLLLAKGSAREQSEEVRPSMEGETSSGPNLGKKLATVVDKQQEDVKRLPRRTSIHYQAGEQQQEEDNSKVEIGPQQQLAECALPLLLEQSEEVRPSMGWETSSGPNLVKRLAKVVDEQQEDMNRLPQRTSTHYQAREQQQEEDKGNVKIGQQQQLAE